MRQNLKATPVYTVVAIPAEAMLAQLAGLTVDGMEIEVVGALSRHLTRSLGLKPDEMPLV